MKTAKKLLVLLLALLLVNVTVLTSFASVTPAVTEANAGNVVTVKFTYNNIAGIYGTFEVDNNEIFDNVEFIPPSGFSGKYNDKNGIIAYYNDTPANFVCTLKITLSSVAKVGDEAKITLEYETTTDGKLPSVPNYSYDYAIIKIVPNVTELNRQIGIAQGLNKDDYTADSWLVLDEALVNAINARTATTQEAVDAATKTLKDAIAALQKKPVIDYSELLATIEIAKQLNQNDYTVTSWSVFADALDAANKAKTATSQEIVDAATKTLKDAIAALQKKPAVPAVDYSELEAQIEAAQKLNQDDYTEASWEVLEKALADAIDAKNYEAQPAVDAAANALKDAIAGLVKKPVNVVDYSELNDQIEIAQALVESEYTPDSWKAVTDALEDAIKAKNSTNQAEVDAATKALKDAITALQKNPGVVVDYSELEVQIEIAQKLKKDDYTPESWEVLEKALADAIDARDSEAQPAVDAAAKALKEAVEGLVKKAPITPDFVDYTKLQEQIDRANDLDENKYTKESWSKVEAALEKAKNLLNTGLQNEVDAAVAELQDAIDALVLKPSGGVDTSATFVIIPVFIIAGLAVALMVITKKKKEKQIAS